MNAAGGDGLELTTPSQAESEAMGLRDWPSTVVTQGGRAAYDSAIEDGALRYVLEGTGTVCRDDGEARKIGPNTLVRVLGTEGGALRWALDEGVDELVLLTPEYKGPPLLPVAAASSKSSGKARLPPPLPPSAHGKKKARVS